MGGGGGKGGNYSRYAMVVKQRYEQKREVNKCKEVSSVVNSWGMPCCQYQDNSSRLKLSIDAGC